MDRIDPRGVNDHTLADVVRRLRRELGMPYGGKDVLSAATKFLWLAHRDVVIIHDSQVRAVLGAEYGDYDEAATKLGVSKSWIYQSDIPYVKLGSRKLYRPTDVARYIEERVSHRPGLNSL